MIAGPPPAPGSAHLPRSPICLLSNEFHPHRGGIAVYSEELARAASSLGHFVEVWAPDHPEAVGRSWPFRYRPIRFEGTQNITCQLKLALSLIDQRRHLRRSIVHLADPGAMLAMTYLHPFRTFRPKATLLTFYGSEILKFHSLATTRMLIRSLVRRAHRIIAISEFTKSLLERYFPGCAGRVMVTPLGARRSVLHTNRIPQKPSGKLVILTVGRIHPRKGQIHLIRALSLLPSELKDRIEYWVVGRGSKENYDAQILEAAPSCGVTFRHFPEVEDEALGGYYAMADIFALTSVEHRRSLEGFGMVYHEAALHGVPSVAHATGGVPEAVVHGETGLLVQPGNHGELAEALGRLISDPELRQRLGAGARARANAFSWEALAQMTYSGL